MKGLLLACVPTLIWLSLIIMLDSDKPTLWKFVCMVILVYPGIPIVFALTVAASE